MASPRGQCADGREPGAGRRPLRPRGCVDLVPAAARTAAAAAVAAATAAAAVAATAAAAASGTFFSRTSLIHNQSAAFEILVV